MSPTNLDIAQPNMLMKYRLQDLANEANCYPDGNNGWLNENQMTLHMIFRY